MEREPHSASIDFHIHAWNYNESYGFAATQTLLVDRRSRII